MAQEAGAFVTAPCTGSPPLASQVGGGPRGSGPRARAETVTGPGVAKAAISAALRRLASRGRVTHDSSPVERHWLSASGNVLPVVAEGGHP